MKTCRWVGFEMKNNAHRRGSTGDQGMSFGCCIGGLIPNNRQSSERIAHLRLNGGGKASEIGGFGRIGDHPIVLGFNQPCERSGYRQIMGNNIDNLGTSWPSDYTDGTTFVLEGRYRGIKYKGQLLHRDAGHGSTPIA